MEECSLCYHDYDSHYVIFLSYNDYGCYDCQKNGNECPVFREETEIEEV